MKEQMAKQSTKKPKVTKASAKPKVMSKKANLKGVASRRTSDTKLIAVDEAAGLIFESEEAMYGYFQPTIDKLEGEYSESRTPEDFNDEEQMSKDHYLDATLDEPDEIWMDEKTSTEFAVFHFIKQIDEGDETFRYIASTYMTKEEEVPSFVFLHFPSKDSRVWMKFQKGDKVYDQNFEEVYEGAVEGDAMGEGDPLAVGLFQAMMKVRGDKDIPQDQFQEFGPLREETIEGADEIWRKVDTEGNVLVSFIREFPDHETGEITYIAVTQEDETSNVHSLLFSFPTNDETLVDRYRQGENLQAEEINQESSH